MDASRTNDTAQIISAAPPPRHVGSIVLRFVVLLASAIALMAFAWSG